LPVRRTPLTDDAVSLMCPRIPRCSHTKSSPASEPPSAPNGSRHVPSPTGLPRNE
jgi:hypothetical protein